MLLYYFKQKPDGTYKIQAVDAEKKIVDKYGCYPNVKTEKRDPNLIGGFSVGNYTEECYVFTLDGFLYNTQFSVDMLNTIITTGTVVSALFDDLEKLKINLIEYYKNKINSIMQNEIHHLELCCDYIFNVTQSDIEKDKKENDVEVSKNIQKVLKEESLRIIRNNSYGFLNNKKE